MMRPFRLLQRVSNFGGIICRRQKNSRRLILSLFVLILVVATYYHKRESVNRFSDGWSSIMLNDGQSVGCRIPKLTPHTPLIDELHRKQALRYRDGPPCVKNYAAKFYIDHDSNLIRIWLTKNKTSNSNFWQMTSCYFHTYRRAMDLPEFEYLNGPIQEITKNSTHLLFHEDEDGQFVSVWCYPKSSIRSTPDLILGKNRSFIIYEDHLLHLPILKSRLLTNERKLRMEEDSKNGNFTTKTSIIVLGIDTTSRMNFMRFMPKSYKFLKEKMNAIDFTSFNTMGYNTYDSVMSMLTGHTQRQLRVDHCPFYMIGLGPLDNCPFILKEAIRRGYVTSFYDEEPFQRGLQPFRRAPPFDFDFRNFIRRQREDVLIGQGTREQTAFECFGSKLTFSINLDLTLKMAHRFGTSGVPYFHFGWTQQLTHVLNKFTKYGDEPLLEFLGQMKTQKFLDNTVLIIVGDHGRREDEPRMGSIQGFFEERLPLLNIVLPNHFHQKFPLARQNLVENSKKFTTALDLHETFKDFFNISTLTDHLIMEKTRKMEADAKNGEKGVSLFLPISATRRCDDLSPQLDQSLCACLPEPRIISVENDPLVQTAADHLVNEVNGRIKPYHQCQQGWSVSRVVETKIYTEFIENDSKTWVYRFKNWWDEEKQNFQKVVRDLYEIKVVAMTPTATTATFSAFLMHLEAEEEGGASWDILDLKRIGPEVTLGESCGVNDDDDEEIRPFCHCLVSS